MGIVEISRSRWRDVGLIELLFALSLFFFFLLHNLSITMLARISMRTFRSPTVLEWLCLRPEITHLPSHLSLRSRISWLGYFSQSVFDTTYTNGAQPSLTTSGGQHSMRWCHNAGSELCRESQ